MASKFQTAYSSLQLHFIEPHRHQNTETKTNAWVFCWNANEVSHALFEPNQCSFTMILQTKWKLPCACAKDGWLGFQANFLTCDELSICDALMKPMLGQSLIRPWCELPGSQFYPSSFRLLSQRQASGLSVTKHRSTLHRHYIDHRRTPSHLHRPELAPGRHQGSSRSATQQGPCHGNLAGGHFRGLSRLPAAVKTYENVDCARASLVS